MKYLITAEAYHFLIVVVATAVLWNLPNARFNLLLEHMTSDDLLEREILAIGYLIGQFSLFMYLSRVVSRISVGPQHLISFALENHTIAMYAEIIGYCVYVQQKLSVHR